jgi:hypothetical protein
MYNITTHVNYFDNASYRDNLRAAMNMNIKTINIQWGQMDDDLDDETIDELLFDSASTTTCMDYIYDKTKNNVYFAEVYRLAAGKMMSTDPNIGLAVLFSYDYFALFHNCLVDYFTNKDIVVNCSILKNKLC